MALQSWDKETRCLYPSIHQECSVTGEVTLHSAEAIPEWLTPEDCPLCHFQQLKKEAFHSQDLGVSHSLHHKMYTCLLKKKNKTVIFKSSSRFTAELRRGYRNFPYAPWPDIWVASPIFTFPYPGGTFVTSDEPALTHHYLRIIITHSPSFTLGFVLGAVHSMGRMNVWRHGNLMWQGWL